MPLIHHLPREYWVLAILVRLGNAPDEELLYQGERQFFAAVLEDD